MSCGASQTEDVATTGFKFLVASDAEVVLFSFWFHISFNTPLAPLVVLRGLLRWLGVGRGCLRLRRGFVTLLSLRFRSHTSNIQCGNRYRSVGYAFRKT